MGIPKLKKTISKYQTPLAFLGIFAASFYLYYPSLSYYFFQDDWFVLNWVRTDDFWSFFKFRTDIIYWRPLTMPIFFKIGQVFFDLKPFGYHLIVFFFHFLNIILVYILFRTLKVSKKISLMSSFLYGTAAFHFVPLSWLSTTSYVIGPTFILSTLILFLTQKIIFSFTFFLFALAASEFTLIAIPILLILKGINKPTLKKLLPCLIISIFYLIARFFIFPLPRTDQYEIGFGPRILTNLFWYFVWTFNIPEKMSTIFFFSKPKSSIIASLQFIRYLILPIILIITFLFTVFLSELNFKKIIKGVEWFILGISPVLLLPKHAFPMYLTVGAIGLFYLFALSLEKLQIKNNLLLLMFSTIWIISSYLTLSFTKETHWTVNEQAISKAYLGYIVNKVEKPAADSLFVLKPADIDFSQKHGFTLIETEENVKQSLNDQDAIQVIYNDSSLKSIYTTHQRELTFPSSIEIFEINPRIND